MGDGGVACVASHVMEHFSASEPYCGERSGSGNNIRGFDANSNSVQFEDRAARSNDSEGDREGSAGTAATAVFGDHAERAKRSSRWDVVQDCDSSRRSKENGLGLGLGLGLELGMHKHGGVQKLDERHASSAENKLGSASENAGKHHLGSQTEKFPFDMRGGGSKSRRLSDGSQSRSGYFEASLSRNSADRHEGHYKTSSSSRITYDRHSRHYELPSSRSSYDRHSRRSGSMDRGHSERSSYDRRWQYEERNGYRKSSAEKFHGRYGSHGYEDRQFHRDARDSRRHSSWRQSHSRWGNQIPDENRGRFSNSCGIHSRSSYCSLTKDLRSKDAELDASPNKTPAWEQSERFPDDSQSEFDNSCFTGPNMISEEICKHEEPRCRGWFYIDQVGIEQGPLKLEELKKLVEDGLLQCDHLVKREGSDEWVTVENAASPMPFGNLSRSTSKFCSQDRIDQLCETSINKVGEIPEDCNNIQDVKSCDNQGRNNSYSKHSTVSVHQDDSDACQVSNNREDFHIDERVERLMEGFTLIQGRENEIVSEALCHAARYVNQDMEHNVESEGSPGLRDGFGKYCSHWRDVELGRGFGSLTNESNVSCMAVRSGIPVEKESDYDKDVSTAMGISLGTEGTAQFAGRWPSKGGDWKRIGEADKCSRIQNVGACERLLKKKIVLNDGVPLCEVWKSGALDPRKQLQEAYCHAVQCKRLELPPWAYRLHEEKSDHLYKIDIEGHMQLGQSSIATPKAHASTPRSQVSTPISQISTPRGSLAGNKSSQHKSSTMKGSNVGKTASSLHLEMKSVLKRNATVFRNYGLSAWDPCAKNQYLERNIVKIEEVADQPLHQQEMGSRCDLPAEGLNMSSPKVHVPDLQGMAEVEAVQVNEKISSGYVGTVNDLKLHMGEWYYRDGAGYEKGPLTFAQLQALVYDGALQKGSSVYRKSDNTWVPVSHHAPLTELLPCSPNLEMIKPAMSVASQNTIGIGGHPENLKQQCQKLQLQEGPADLAYTLHPGVLHTSDEQMVKDSLCQHPGTASPVHSVPEQYKLEDCSTNQVACSFHDLYPQFIGYSRGKLHEHVMKFYRSRDFLAAINEVLDAWMAPEQSKKCTEMRFASPLRAPRPSAAGIAVTFNHVEENHNSQKSEVRVDEILNNLMTDQQGIDHKISHAGLSVSEFEKNGARNRLETELEDNFGHIKHHYVSKRRRLQVIQENDRGDSTRKELEADTEVDRSYGELEGEAAHCIGINNGTQNKMHGWGMMDFRILERIFHFLGADLKSVAFTAATCKRWNRAIRSLKDKSRRIDLSFMGPDCSDAMFRSIMGGYVEGKIKYVVLRGCTNVSVDTLVHFLRACSSVISVDITGCSQFKEVIRVFPNVKWVRNHIAGPSSSGDLSEEAHCKVKSLKQINDKSYGTICKPSRGLDIHLSDDSAGKDTFMSPPEADQGEPMDVDDFQVDGKALVSPLHQHVHSVKRVKLSNSGKSAKVNLEDVSLKGEASVKSSTVHLAGGDKSIEKHLVVALKAIMGVNTSNFFLHEASEIEGKIKDGVYSGYIHGINSFKDDIFLICRKAFQEHKKGSPAHAAAENMFKTTHRLVSILEKKFSKWPANGNDVILRSGKDKSQSSFYSTGLSLNKRHARGMKVGAKRIKRRRGKYYSDCSVDIEEYGSDREGRRLSKLKRRHWQDSETETSESSDFVEEEYLEKEDDKNDSEDSDPDMKFEFEGEDGAFGEDRDALEDGGLYSEISAREWGARMTKVSFVPPVPRKYEVIDEYVVVADEEQVHRKMKVCLPDDYDEKLRAAKEKRDGDYAHLEIPDLKEYKPRKQLGYDVLEQEVYGIDPYTHNLLLDTMPKGSDYSLQQQHLIIEEVLLRALNQKVRSFTGTGKAPMEYPLQNVVQKMQKDAEKAGDSHMQSFCQGLLKAMQSRQTSEKYVAYRKGLGVVCNKEGGFEKDDFVVEFLGEVYPAWRWHEKQDGIRSLQNGIRSLQKKDKDPAPEFYNINLERPKGDGAGYDLVVVDAMHKANYASRICHSCRPNCEAKVTAVDGQYQIGVYTVRPIQYGEEITFDYNSLTESKEEYEASVCLCGSQGCRGSFLNLAGAGPYQKVLNENHGLLNRHHLLLEACTVNSVTEEDNSDLRSAGLGACLLSGLPDWATAYSARVVRFINIERNRLPEQIVKHSIKEKKKAGVEISHDLEKSDSEIQADGVYNQRLQSLAITLDKAMYIMRKVYQDPRKAPPPLRKLRDEELVSVLWKGEQSLVEELLRCMAPYVDAERLNDLKHQISAHDPSGSQNVGKRLRESLLWLRDEVRHMPSSCRSRHDAAADLIHLYAYTKYFFSSRDYTPFQSPPLYIGPLDLGPKYANSLGSGFQEWQKTYSKDYALGQLIYWYTHTAAEPGSTLAKARRGCLVLPDVSSCYAKTPKQEFSRGYGTKEHAEMIRRMERQPQKPWPKGEFWEFRNNRGLFGSPMLDAVMNNSPLDKEMMLWLKNRPVVFDGPWDH